MYYGFTNEYSNNSSDYNQSLGVKFGVKKYFVNTPSANTGLYGAIGLNGGLTWSDVGYENNQYYNASLQGELGYFLNERVNVFVQPTVDGLIKGDDSDSKYIITETIRVGFGVYFPSEMSFFPN